LLYDAHLVKEEPLEPFACRHTVTVLSQQS
jgi:hypothetical protein